MSWRDCHLLGKQRGSTLHASLPHYYGRKRRDERGPGTYRPYANDLKEINSKIGKTAPSYLNKQPRLQPAKNYTFSSADDPNLDRNPDPWNKKYHKSFISDLDRYKVPKAARREKGSDFFHVEKNENGRLPSHSINYLTTAKGCFYDNKWISVQSSTNRLSSRGSLASSKPARYSFAIGENSEIIDEESDAALDQ